MPWAKTNNIKPKQQRIILKRLGTAKKKKRVAKRVQTLHINRLSSIQRKIHGFLESKEKSFKRHFPITNSGKWLQSQILGKCMWLCKQIFISSCFLHSLWKQLQEHGLEMENRKSLNRCSQCLLVNIQRGDQRTYLRIWNSIKINLIKTMYRLFSTIKHIKCYYIISC